MGLGAEFAKTLVSQGKPKREEGAGGGGRGPSEPQRGPGEVQRSGAQVPPPSWADACLALCVSLGLPVYGRASACLGS